MAGDLNCGYNSEFLGKLKELQLHSPHLKWMDPQEYLTRFPIGDSEDAPSGLDWILVCPKLMEKVTACGIEEEVGRLRITTDHCPVYIDIDLCPRNNPIEDEQTIKYQYKKISSIPIRQLKDEEGRSYLGFDKSKYRTQAIRDSEKLYRKLQEKIAEDDHQQRAAETNKGLKQLLNLIKEKAVEENWDHQQGELPSRDPELCRLLDKLLIDFFLQMKKIMMELKLTTRSSAKSHDHPRLGSIQEGG